MKARDIGINWSWYLDYDEVSEDVIRINRHYRIHHSEAQPETTVNFRLDENKDRTVTGAYLNGRYVLVENEKHVFDYK